MTDRYAPGGMYYQANRFKAPDAASLNPWEEGRSRRDDVMNQQFGQNVEQQQRGRDLQGLLTGQGQGGPGVEGGMFGQASQYVQGLLSGYGDPQSQNMIKGQYLNDMQRAANDPNMHPAERQRMQQNLRLQSSGQAMDEAARGKQQGFSALGGLSSAINQSALTDRGGQLLFHAGQDPSAANNLLAQYRGAPPQQQQQQQQPRNNSLYGGY